jgi:dimethylglycine dehydrogenase
VDLSKDFRSKAAMEGKGIRSMCVTLLIDGPQDADPRGREGIFLDGQKVGRLTSGGYLVAFGKQIGIGTSVPIWRSLARS